MGYRRPARLARLYERYEREARDPQDLINLVCYTEFYTKMSEVLLHRVDRVAMRHLPPSVVQRPKMGFSFPFKEWLRGPLGPVVERTLEDSRLFRDGWLDGPFCRRLLNEHRGGRTDHAPRLWMLYSLARWYDRWIA